MVSRRRILSRSRDDLNLEVAYQEEEDDVWYKKEKLYSDHIREVLTKWDSIDDEIWAKIIVFERNRRVAKAYARVGVLTIHGSDMGFDGSKIGLCGFDNPLRDPKIENAKRYIGAGVKIKMDKDGNMMVKRLAKSNVYVRYATGENAVSSEILKLPQAALEANKGLALFDLKKFHQNVNREMKRQYPDRTRLETQCMTSLAFVKNDDDLLNCPCWVLIINIVALDMLKGKLMPVPIAPSVQPASRSARIPIPDEDPYSMAGSGGSSGSSGKQARTERPPKLPPRDTDRNGRGDSADYADDADDMELTQNGGISGMRARLQSSRSKNKKDRKKGDELYYAGFQARIPNFAKSKPSRDYPRDPRAAYMAGPHGMPMPHPAMMQSRSYESGMDSPFFSGPRVRVPGFRGVDPLAESESNYSLLPTDRCSAPRRLDPRRASWSRLVSDSEAAAESRRSRHGSRRRSQSRDGDSRPRQVASSRVDQPGGGGRRRSSSRAGHDTHARSLTPAGGHSPVRVRAARSPAAPHRAPSPARGRAPGQTAGRARGTVPDRAPSSDANASPGRAFSPVRDGDHRPPLVPLSPNAISTGGHKTAPGARVVAVGAHVCGRHISPARADRFVEAMREKFEGARLPRRRKAEE